VLGSALAMQDKKMRADTNIRPSKKLHLLNFIEISKKNKKKLSVAH
jgi:hypothetical protein